jgi:hypothetical protein
MTSAAFAKTHEAARTSYEAWSAFCAALTPGREMDANVELCIYGHLAREPVWKYSIDYGRAALLMDEMDRVEVDCPLSIRDREHDARRWRVRVRAADTELNVEYEGEGVGRFFPEAMCRAVLDMYRPSDDECRNWVG